jgi:hypothetical protein
LIVNRNSADGSVTYVAVKRMSERSGILLDSYLEKLGL